jgi:antitoxin VapB
MRVTSVDRPQLAVYPTVYTERGISMKTAKIFRSGNSQAVRIPKEFQLEGDEVEILKRGRTLVLRPKKKSWVALVDSLQKFTDDFMEKGRNQPPVQKRDRAFS